MDGALAKLQERSQFGLAQFGAHPQGEQLLPDSIITRSILMLPPIPLSSGAGGYATKTCSCALCAAVCVNRQL